MEEKEEGSRILLWRMRAQILDMGTEGRGGGAALRDLHGLARALCGAVLREQRSQRVQRRDRPCAWSRSMVWMVLIGLLTTLASVLFGGFLPATCLISTEASTIRWMEQVARDHGRGQDVYPIQPVASYQLKLTTWDSIVLARCRIVLAERVTDFRERNPLDKYTREPTRRMLHPLLKASSKIVLVNGTDGDLARMGGDLKCCNPSDRCDHECARAAFRRQKVDDYYISQGPQIVFAPPGLVSGAYYDLLFSEDD